MTRDPHQDSMTPERPRKSGSPSTLVDGLLEDDRITLDSAPESVLTGLFKRVAADTVDHVPSGRERLQELATPTRVALASFGVVGIGATFLALMGTRQDLDPSAMTWLAVLHVGVLIGAVGGLGLALRPAHRSPLNGLAWVAVATLGMAPIALSLFPGLIPGNASPVPALGHLMCGGGGVLIALPATVLVLLLDRSREPSTWRVLMASGAAGLVAFGFGHWHCPMVDPVHLIVAHGLLGSVLGLSVLAVVRAASWLRRRAATA